jgi:hypothetical protein
MALMLTSAHGDKYSVALLLDRGAMIDAKDTVRISQRHFSLYVFLMTNYFLCRTAGRP